MPVKTKKAKTPVKELTGVQDLYHFLYEACNILRKFVEHESFKDYITPLLYYKRLCDVWDEEYEAALAESGNDEEYARLPEQHRFVIPKECHWEEVRARPENLGAAIVEALLMIEQANPDTLYGVLSVFPTDNFRDKNKLSDEVVRNLIEHLSSRKLGNKDYPADLMGEAYEILLKSFADESKAKAGEFYTPRKKPLKSLENIVNGVTDGIQGKDIYEINRKIIDLSEPLLTDEAKDGLNNEMHAPLSDEDRDIKNIYDIIYKNGMNDLLDEKIFGSIFGMFERIMKMEKEFSKKS